MASLLSHWQSASRFVSPRFVVFNFVEHAVGTSSKHSAYQQKVHDPTMTKPLFSISALKDVRGRQQFQITTIWGDRVDCGFQTPSGSDRIFCSSNSRRRYSAIIGFKPTEA